MTAPVKHRRTVVTVWLAALAMILLTWWHVSELVQESRTRELASAERSLANLTRVSQEHADRTLRNADQVIRFIQSRYLDVGNSLNLSALTAQGVIDGRLFTQVGILSEKGLYVLSNLPIKGNLDLSEGDHFQAHVAADTGTLYISKPVFERAKGKWSIQLSRRITRHNGEFAGVVVVSIDPGYFTRFYSDLKLGAQGVVGLYRLDGVALARKIGVKEEFGTQAGSSPMFTRIGWGELVGSYTQRSEVDGIERMFHYRKIPDYQLAVVAGLDTPYLLANLRQDRDALLLQASLLSLLLLTLAAALTRHLWQINRIMAARQLAQLQIQERTEQLNAIFTLSPDGFVSFDRFHRVKYISPTFIQMTMPGSLSLIGLSEHDFSTWLMQRCKPGRPFFDIPELRSQVCGGKPDSFELIELGEHVKRLLQVRMRCSDSATVAQILYFRDVTHETAVEQLKSEFLSTAAHELRTPMASILGFSEVLLAQNLDAASHQEFLNIIYDQSKVMAHILDELLDLARIEARRDKDFCYTRVCLQELTEVLVKAFNRPLDRASPELVMPTEPLYVMADFGKLNQAILNILSNAYKYSPAGGPVTYEIETQEYPGRPPRVCIHITDTGIGMTPEQQRRVYERFYRADSSGKIPGTGLGMSIVKEIIELHGGDITISSTFGKGTRVTLCLPMTGAEETS